MMALRRVLTSMVLLSGFCQPIVDSDAVVSSFLSEYGEVLSVEYGYYNAFPSLQNGNRVVKILLSKDIPGFVQFDGFDCRV